MQTFSYVTLRPLVKERFQELSHSIEIKNPFNMVVILGHFKLLCTPNKNVKILLNPKVFILISCFTMRTILKYEDISSMGLQ